MKRTNKVPPKDGLSFSIRRDPSQTPPLVENEILNKGGVLEGPDPKMLKNRSNFGRFALSNPQNTLFFARLRRNLDLKNDRFTLRNQQNTSKFSRASGAFLSKKKEFHP